MKSNFGWHVIYVKFRHEGKVQNDLERYGVESFVPMTSTIKNWSDRKKKVSTPLFPSYVFVNIQSNADFHRALSLDSAASFVKFGSEYGRLTDEEIECIKHVVSNENFTDVKANYDMPEIGDRGTIEYGKLYGIPCEVYKIENDNLLRVRIESLHQNLTAKVPAHYFQIATKVSA